MKPTLFRLLAPLVRGSSDPEWTIFMTLIHSEAVGIPREMLEF